MHLYRTLLVLALAVLVLSVPATAGIAQTYNDTVSGHEYFATSTDGKFAGTASGALPGYWNTDVQHTPLCLSCTPTATITGGSVELATTLDGSLTLVTGDFTGGDGSANLSGPSDGQRVLRGGSWSHNPAICRSAYRDSIAPDFSGWQGRIGLRVVCTV